MKLDIAIIDYGLSNINSVLSAVKKFNLDTQITNNKNDIMDAKACILPGVGNFSKAMDNINKLNIKDTIIDFVNSKKPFFGICLGMQLLFDSSNESNLEEGLGIIPGKVLRFSNYKKGIASNIGWRRNTYKNISYFKNQLQIKPLADVKKETFFYFVHSCYVDPLDKKIVYSTSQFEDLIFCSSIIYENIFACQFHPEKSSYRGLNIFENFLKNVKS